MVRVVGRFAPVLALLLAACHQATPQETAASMIHGCAAEAADAIDPSWGPRQVTGTYPSTNGVDVVISSGKVQVTASCETTTGYYTTMLAQLAKVQGIEPVPGQLYLPAKGRWLTDDELHARLTTLLAPKPDEYSGSSWTPNDPGDYRISDLAGAPSTDCAVLQSKLDPTHQLVTCQVATGHRYWVAQGLLALEVAPPPGLPPIPTPPPTNWATQPSGAPPH
ncbi:MAG TPA: hypothetical protein VHW60_14655 [Caulobacteraceae bacterium]|nr:hypothetical protein [Caulobacteraceae bacterium]